MKRIVTEIASRLLSDTPTWFKRIAQMSGLVAVICAALVTGSSMGEFHINEKAYNYIKMIGAAATAVAVVALTAKKDKEE
jgi:predicted MFS family arabinose efflux permease